MRALGRVSYVTAFSLTLISLALLSGPAGSARHSGQQRSPSQTSTAPKPTASWMAATSNPLTIAVTLDQGSSVTENIRSRGGEITATGPDGTRFTLTIPKDALLEATEITMTPVADVKNLPLSGGLVAAVQISPEDLLFLKAPTLIVKTPAPIPSAEQMQFASFAYRGNGQEFHLYPMETDPNRIAFKLLHFGGFGVARGTEEEQEKIRGRLPTDSMDRLMMHMQKLKSISRKRLLAKTAARHATEDDGWRLVKASMDGTEPQPWQGGELTRQMMRDIVKQLRESYHQDVMPKLKDLRMECRSNMLIRVREAISRAQAWQKSVDLLGMINRLSQEELTSEEKEMLITERVNAEGLTGAAYQRRIRNFNRGGFKATETEIRKIERDRLRREGYTEQEVEELLKEFESIRAEFQPMYDELNRLIYETLKKAYDKAYQCCLQEGKEFYLTMMDRAGSYLSRLGLENAVSMEKRNECLCAIQSVSAEQSRAWTGQITQTETFVNEKNETTGSEGRTRQTKDYKKFDYRAVINLVYHARELGAGEEGGRIPAQVSARGFVISSGGLEDHGKSVSMEKRWGSTWEENYDGNVRSEDTNVEVRIRPDGTYTVDYHVPCVEASGLRSSLRYVRGTGFPEHQKLEDPQSRQVDRNVCPTQEGTLVNGQPLGITGKLDSMSTKVVTGSKTFEIPLPENRDVNRTITITWNLKRCK